RHGSRSIAHCRELGYLPIAIINYLARLGHYYPNEAFMSLAELAIEFKISNLSKSPAKFNQQQLDFWQKQAVEKLSPAEFLTWAGGPVLAESVGNNMDLFIDAVKPNVLFPADVSAWAQICFSDHLTWQDAEI